MDPDEYAKAVVSGELVACLHVIEACKRHLRDREEGKYHWDPTRGKEFELFLASLDVTDSYGRVVRFDLLPWQRFIMWSILCWLVKPGDEMERVPGSRRFRRVTVMTGKGSGKSTMFAATALWMMHFDGYYPWGSNDFIDEYEPQCYVLAATRDQVTETAMGPARKFSFSEVFDNQVVAFGGESSPNSRIFSERTGGFMRGVSVSGKGAGGRRVHYLQVEEMSEIPPEKERIISDYRASTKQRVQPLVVFLSNAGRERLGPAWEERQRAISIASGDGPEDAFAFMAEVDAKDLKPPGSDIWYPHRDTWAKANPSLGQTIRPDYIKTEIARSTTVMDREEVLRLNFGYWPGDVTALCTLEEWMALETHEVTEPPPNAMMYVGIDLGSRSDFTALAYAWDLGDGSPLVVRVDQYAAMGSLRKQNEASTGPLITWGRTGKLKTTSGDSLDYELPARDLLNNLHKYPNHRVCRDSWNRLAFDTVARNIGMYIEDWSEGVIPELAHGMIRIQPHSQLYRKANSGGLWMESSIDALSTLILTRKMLFYPDPVLRWNVQCVEIIKDTQLNRRFDRRNPSFKVDGIVALAMACGLWELETSKVSTPLERWAAEVKASRE